MFDRVNENFSQLEESTKNIRIEDSDDEGEQLEEVLAEPTEEEIAEQARQAEIAAKRAENAKKSVGELAAMIGGGSKRGGGKK
jgi:nitrate reductase beta subunit